MAGGGGGGGGRGSYVSLYGHPPLLITDQPDNDLDLSFLPVFDPVTKDSPGTIVNVLVGAVHRSVSHGNDPGSAAAILIGFYEVL